MSDIEDEGFDAIWTDMTAGEVDELRADAKRSGAAQRALIAQEKADGTWKPLPPAPPGPYDDVDDVPY